MLLSFVVNAIIIEVTGIFYIVLNPLCYILYARFFERNKNWALYIFYGVYPVITIDLLKNIVGLFLLLDWIPPKVVDNYYDVILFIGFVAVIPFHFGITKLFKIDFTHLIRAKSLKDMKKLMVPYNTVMFSCYVLERIISGIIINSPSFSQNEELTKYIIFIYFVIFISMLVFLNIKSKELLEKQIYEQKEAHLRDLQNYTEHIESLYKEIRSFRHDYTNILISLKESINSKDIEQVQQIYNSVLAQSDAKFKDSKYDIGKLVNLSIPAIKSVLSAKLLEAQSLGIDVSIEIPDTICETHLEPLDLITILSILLDNAVEATAEAKNSKISIAYFSQGKTQFLVIENSTKQEKVNLKNIFNYGCSTKGENRGIGLANVTQTLEKYPLCMLKTKSDNYQFRQTLEMRKSS